MISGSGERVGSAAGMIASQAYRVLWHALSGPLMECLFGIFNLHYSAMLLHHVVDSSQLYLVSVSCRAILFSLSPHPGNNAANKLMMSPTPLRPAP